MKNGRVGEASTFLAEGELGGHPDSRSVLLFEADADQIGHFLLADALDHIGDIWNHVVAWEAKKSVDILIEPNAQLLSRIQLC
ncbi:MAG: hypothetical protein ACK6BG_04420 [Cyanobacteriota bacterium]|jgi:hypothetical protein